MFTGFDAQRDRGNVEYDNGINQIDPMQMKARHGRAADPMTLCGSHCTAVIRFHKA